MWWPSKLASAPQQHGETLAAALCDDTLALV
jgi:hypothetical protein